MGFEYFADIGKQLSRNGGLTNVALEKIDSEVRIVCLLCEMSRQLDTLANRLDKSTPHSQPKTVHPVSDGAIECLGRGTLIRNANLDGLSVRARKTLRRARVRYVEDLDRDDLMQTYMCGVTTANELMKWRECHGHGNNATGG